MIKLVTDIKQLDFLGGTPFGCKIISTANAYGLNCKPVMFWAQDFCKAAMAKVDGSLIIEDNGAQTEELASFINMINPQNISCLKSTALKLGFPSGSAGEIMAFQNGKVLTQKYKAVINPGIREIYGLLSACRTKSFVPPEFEPFYLDMSHRTRHKAALSAGIKRSGRLVSCAVCTAVSKKAAVISAVSCLPEFRRKGFASFAVSSLISLLNRDIVYIFRADGENENFYRSIGFKPYGFWSETKIR